MYGCLGQIKLLILPLHFWLSHLNHLLMCRDVGQHTKCPAAATYLPFLYLWIYLNNKEMVAVFPPYLPPKWLCPPASQLLLLMPLFTGILLCCGHQFNQIYPARPGNSQRFQRACRDWNFSRKNLLLYLPFVLDKIHLNPCQTQFAWLIAESHIQLITTHLKNILAMTYSQKETGCIFSRDRNASLIC